MDYDQVAKHYDAYRPPLHARILERCVGKSSFSSGLDVGCGSGDSSVALAGICSDVIGIDPSQAMVDRAKAHARVEYRQTEAGQLPIHDDTMDVITFAGSWFYAKSQTMVEEVERVLRPGGLAITYDFDVRLKPILDMLGLSMEEGAYDHACNFNGLKYKMEATREGLDEEDFRLSKEEAAHLMLASYGAVLIEISGPVAYDQLLKTLDERNSKNYFDLKALVYYTVYQKP